MGSKTAYLERVQLAQALGGAAWTPPDTWYVALSTDPFDPSTINATFTEPAAGDYARLAVANGAAHWHDVASGGVNPSSTYNVDDWTFPAAANDWGTIRSVYLCTAGGTGAGQAAYGTNVVGGGVPIGPGGQFQVAGGTFVVREGQPV